MTAAVDLPVHARCQCQLHRLNVHLGGETATVQMLGVLRRGKRCPTCNLDRVQHGAFYQAWTDQFGDPAWPGRLSPRTRRRTPRRATSRSPVTSTSSSMNSAPFSVGWFQSQMPASPCSRQPPDRRLGALPGTGARPLVGGASSGRRLGASGTDLVGNPCIRLLPRGLNAPHPAPARRPHAPPVARPARSSSR
jgi:hypothetical protein